MVQRKVTKKPKAKEAPAASAKTAKQNEVKKSATLSNGFAKIQPDKDKTKDSEKSASDKPLDEPMETSSSKGNDDEVPKSTTPGSSKSPVKDELDNPEEVAKSEQIAESSTKQTRKRKIESKPKPEASEKKAVKTKSKSKRQKIVLEVPTLSSITGKVFVVGENDVGQLGLDEEVDSKEKPFLLDLPFSIIDIAAGGMHSVCLTENAEVITFGCNDEGALGRVAADEEERIPKKVNIPEKIVQISAGDSHSAALAESGQVYLWGNFRNSEGQMGLTADGQRQITPVKVLTDKTIVKIASGGDHLACLSNDGIVYTCGCGEQGQLGRVNARACRDGGRKGRAALLEPAAVDRLTSRVPIKDVWTESYATFLKAQETESIYAFGLNNYNQLGFENRNSDQENQMIFFPQSVPSFNDKSWKQIIGGQHHTLGLDTKGLVFALGRKDYGRLGLGPDCEDKSVPSAIPTLEKEKCNSVSCGNCVSFAVTDQGSLYSWGMAASQLGHGSANEEDILAPRLIKGELLNSWEVLKVSGGGQHALVLACPKKGSSKDKKA